MLIRLRGGWQAEVTEGSDGSDILIWNPTEDGRSKFFSVSTEGNPYGAPMIEQEPSLGIPLRQAGVAHDGNIVGFIVVDAEGQVVERASLSNLTFMKDQEYLVNPAGELIIGGESRGFLRSLVLPDKNRMTGYVGFCGPEPRADGKIKILELEDLALLAVA